MEKPHYSTDDLYKVMKDCWLSEPGLRPTFNELVEKMADELQEGEKQVTMAFKMTAHDLRSFRLENGSQILAKQNTTQS